MRIKYRAGAKAEMAALALSFIMALSLADCVNPADPAPPDRIYILAANGSATEAVTELTITFAAAESGLTADHIVITNGAGQAAKNGGLSGSGPAYTLLLNVAQAGTITVTINKDGVDRTPKTVTVYKPALDDLLRGYMGAIEQIWGEPEHPEDVKVYYLDPEWFEEFKNKLDTGGEYYEADHWINTRDWDQEKKFARLGVRNDGRFTLELCDTDNSVDGYWYKQVPQAEASWEETWDEGKITLTYLGLQTPSGFVPDPDRGTGGRREYKGYYKFRYEAAQDGHHERYVYYQETGNDAQYSQWLD